jgi:SAM-dependent methyltransferase
MVYEVTNESIPAIIAGLGIQVQDRVLSICGSGDSIFAIAELANQIVGVDRNSDQIKYAKKREKYLKSREFKEFLTTSDHATSYFVKSRNKHFNSEKCEKISSRLEGEVNISWELEDIFYFNNPKSPFNKIYLSNCLTYFGSNIKTINFNLQNMANFLPKEGLIYVSDYDKINRFSKHKLDFLNETGLVLDEKMSERAKTFQFQENFNCNSSFEGWVPAVFKKV